MNAVEALLASEAARFFPSPTSRDQALFEALPDEFILNVPYQVQETQSGSGSACLAMLCAFHGLDPAPGLRFLRQNEGNWAAFNHETLAEDFVRVALGVGLLPYVYYPGRFVLPKFEEGYQGADFIAGNIGIISPFDRELMKAAIFGSKGPLYARIHFATDEYKMSEEMAQIMDTAGHALLLCGWNRDGFLVHDPWNANEWGGYGGGGYRLLTYKRLSEMKPLVNCCLEESIGFAPIGGFIRAWENAVFENRDMPIRFQLEVPPLPSYYYDYIKWDYSFELSTAEQIVVKDRPGPVTYDDCVRDGGAVATWNINTGPKPGSYPVDVTVTAEGLYPVFPWESAARSALNFQTKRIFKARLDIKRLDWLNKYART